MSQARVAFSTHAISLAGGADQPCEGVVGVLDPLALLVVRLVAADLGLALQVTDVRVEHRLRRQRRAGVVEVGDVLAARGVCAQALDVERHASSTVNSVSCMPSGASRRTLLCRHGVTTGPAMCVAPACCSSLRRRGRVLDLEREADRPGDPPADLDAVDGLRVRRVEQLERRAAGVEEHDAPVVAPRLEQRQSECVAVERERRVEVVDGESDAELLHGHSATLIVEPSARHRV